MNFIIHFIPQKIYKLSKTNTFFSRFEGTRGEKTPNISHPSSSTNNEATSLEQDVEQIEDPSSGYPEPPPSPPDMDIPAFKEDLSEVTSTVTIKTPDPEESIRSSANPAVWKGEINMPDVADFGVTAHQGK